MEQFTYTNQRGDTLTFNYTGDYLIDSYSGLSGADIIPIVRSGYLQNGVSLFGVNMGIRIITLSFFIHSNSMAQTYERRNQLAQVFNPLLGQGTLTYTNDYLSRKIDVLPTALPEPKDKYGTLQRYEVQLTAHNPLWYQTAENSILLSAYTGVHYPMKFNSSIRFESIGSFADLTNSGDVEAPIRAEFRNAAENPTISLNTTGSFIKVSTSIENGEKLIINTAYGNKTADVVRIDGVVDNANNLVDYQSTYFNLPVGTNRINFSTTSGTPQVFLYWRNWYIGV